LFPTKKPVSRTGGAVGDTGAGSPPAAPAAESLSARPPVRPSGPVSAPAETVWVTSPTYRLGFSTRGASLVSAELLGNRSFAAADYRFAVRGRFGGFGSGGATLLVGLGDGLRSVEADSMDDFRHYAVVTKAAKTQSTDFQALKPGERKILDGPFEWAGVKSKYFFLAALAFEENQPRFGA